MSKDTPFHLLPHVFVVGSPRSGTTLLAATLGDHPDLAYYYEPYFIWDFIDGTGDDDIRTRADLNEAARDYISREFAWFLRKSGKKVLVEKTPENSFRIDYISHLFPNARFIHITRAGIEAVVSLNREWLIRKNLVRKRSPKELFRVIRENFVEYPFRRCWYLLVKFELKTRAGLNPRNLFNKSKWKGEIGYGPRFQGWEQAYAEHDLLSFNALQWRHSVEACIESLDRLPSERVLTIKYEDIVADPRGSWTLLQRFAGVSDHPEHAPVIRQSRAATEKQHLPPGDRARIRAIVAPVLERLGYGPDAIDG
ncbi:MAG: sulfotransferase family protein [Gammaproteobacteria bacterium]